MKEAFNIGDLVDFNAPDLFSSAKRGYKAPGIVLEVNPARGHRNTEAYRVRWHDGKLTTEWHCYLRKLGEHE